MRALALAVVFATLILGAGSAHGEVFENEGLRVWAKARIAPRVLPRDRAVPVSVQLGGRIGTVDDTRPPALSELSIAVNRASRFSVAGLPTCRAAQLQQTTTEAALAACRPALVGHGTFSANVDFSEGPAIPAAGKVLAFNARVGRRPGMLLHFYGSSPVQAAFVLPLSISHRRGELGTVLSTRIPSLAAGLGYVTELHLKLGRRYGYRGKRRGYLNASCAAPAGFTSVPFRLARMTLAFADGRRVRGSLSRACRVRRAGASSQ